MTEAEWLADNISLFFKADFLRHRVGSHRRARLFACACCRRVWHRVQSAAARRSVELAEAYADGEVTAEELQAAANPVWFSDLEDRLYGEAEPRFSMLAYYAIQCAKWLAAPIFDTTNAGTVAEHTAIDPANDFFPTPEMRRRPSDIYPDGGERRIVGELQRDIFGNPFRTVNFKPEWRSSTALNLANQMYQSRDFSVMPKLADALREAGCDSEEILSHCLEDRPHVRGCWVVDLVLSKTAKDK